MYINSDNKVERFTNNLKKNNKENFQDKKYDGAVIAVFVIMGIFAVIMIITIIWFIRDKIKNNGEGIRKFLEIYNPVR